MNVSSVPYSLSDIQLPDSPATNVKQQNKSDSIHAQSDEEQASNNTYSNISRKAKKPEEGDMNGKTTKPEIKDRTSEDIKQGSDNEKAYRSKVPGIDSSKEVKSDSSSGDEKVKLKDKGRRKKHDSSDDNQSSVKKSSESSRSRRRRNRSSSAEDRGRSRSKSPKGSKSSRGRRRSPSSEKEHRSKAKHKKGGSKKEKSKKRDRRSPSSDGSPSPHKDRGPRKPYKVRRKEGNVSSDEERHSKTRRESPQKDAKLSRKDRSLSSDEESNSRTHKKGTKNDVKRKDRSVSSSDERNSRTRNRESPKKVVKVGRKDRNASSGEESNSRTHKKGTKNDVKSKDRSSSDERNSRTRSRESTKKDAKVVPKDRSASSGDEFNSRTHKDDTKSDIKRKDRSISSGDEHNSRTRSREIPKKEAESALKDTSVSSGDERKSRTRRKESPEKVTEVSQREKDISLEKDFKSKASDAMEVEQISQTIKSASEVSPTKEPTRTSQEKQSPKKAIASDSETSSPESSPRKISHSTEKDTITEHKHKHSVSSDEDSKKTEIPVKKSKPTTPDDSPDLKKSPEKMDCESSKEDPPESRHSRRDSSPNSKPQANRTDSLRSGSPEKVNDKKFRKRPPTPKETHSRENSPEKTVTEDAKKVSKDEVSDGELPSSQEGSPVRNAGARKPSTSSLVSRSSTMIVIRKEPPKQKLKIKRDNVVVVKKEKEALAEEDISRIETEVIETPEPIENLKLEPGECPDVPPNTNYVRRKIVLSSRKQVENPSDEPATKKSKWGSFAASRKAKQTVSISTDSLKNWFPDFKILKEPTPETIPEELPSPVKEEEDVEMTPIDKVTESSEPKMIAITRRLEPLPAEAALKPPTEPVNDDEQGVEPTPILFVQNLVRPFTLLQLKELLGETGKMVEDGFWIDKIKSKCFVTYNTVEEAVKTRKILNGARWPMSNPKILAVSFATEEDLSSHRSGLADQPKPRPPSPPKEDQPIRREGRTRMVVPMREWDKDKVTQDSPEKHDRRREDEKLRDKKELKKRVASDDTPAKLLDDLFQKTKAIPCIYWLPLTQEQVKERDERKKQINQERDRKNLEREQENKRPHSRQRETRRSSPSRSRSPLTRRR